MHGVSQVVLVVKNLPANAGDIRDLSSIPGLGGSPGEGHGNPLQYSCQDNPMDREAWWATVHRVTRIRYDYATNTSQETTCSLIFLSTPDKQTPHPTLIHSTNSHATAAAKPLQLCLTLCDPRDGSLPDSPVPGILQARTLQWVAISFSNA